MIAAGAARESRSIRHRCWSATQPRSPWRYRSIGRSGCWRDDAYRAAQLELQPGDRLVMLTDGMLERGAAALDLQARLQHLSGLHPREVVSVLADLVVDIAGPILPDDACLLVLDWLGADPDRASTPHHE